MNSNPVSRYHSAKINLQSHSQFKPCLWLPSALGMESLFYPVIKYLSESILSFFPKFPLSFPIYQISHHLPGNFCDLQNSLFSECCSHFFNLKNKTRQPLRHLRWNKFSLFFGLIDSLCCFLLHFMSLLELLPCCMVSVCL